MVVSGQSRGRGETQHIDDNAADGMAYIVFLRRCAQVVTEKIRNHQKSDLSERKRKGGNKKLAKVIHMAQSIPILAW